jgi:tetratricopeptide (TPR) repeat protein
VIGLFIKIPFHSQIRNSEPRLAAELEKAVDEVVSAFAASRFAIEESYLLIFDEFSRPCRLRAAEAARSLMLKLSAIAARLFGWALLLDAGASSADESLGIVKRLWFDIEVDGLYLSARSKAYFADYFSLEPNHGEGKGVLAVQNALYARPALLAEGLVSEGMGEVPAWSVDQLVDVLGELVIGPNIGKTLLVLGQGQGPSRCIESALSKLYPDSSTRFLRISASAVEGAPYGPIASSLKNASGASAHLSGPERGLLNELPSLLDFLRRSPYRRAYSPQIDVRLRLCANAFLKNYAREMRANGLPAFLILEGIEDFPDPSIMLILRLAQEDLAGEGLAILAEGSDSPRCWIGPASRILAITGSDPAAIAKAALRGATAVSASSASAALALTTAGDPLRFKLALRLLASGQDILPDASTESLAAKTLATFPREYAELFLDLRLGEQVLTDECMESYLRDSGYYPGVRAPVYDSLAELGFITREARPRIATSAAASRSEDALPDGGAAVRADFTARLLKLREQGLIIPSAAFYRHISMDRGHSGATEAEGIRNDYALAFDCIAADAIYGVSEPPGAETLDSPLEPMARFLHAYALSERAACLSALENLEANVTKLSAIAGLAGNPRPEAGLQLDASLRLAKAVASLARATFEYADGRAQKAAILAKEALINLHALGAHKAEAKAHRILGLCALAQEQVQEGADYLANAYDLASSLPEPFECILSATAEAAADFSLGDLSKAASRADAAADWAASAFRADWESAAAFIKGRASLEIGRYEEAEEYFGRVRTIARVYGEAEAGRRAEIWIGRSAAFAGEELRAREILRRFGDDAEALWFLAELEAWENSPVKAVTFADEALALAVLPRFSTADSFDWGSGFASLEGRAVGFCATRSYLYDQIAAFRDFAAGMASPETEGADCAARLATRVREDRLAVIHPSSHLYLFYRYLILERMSPGSMDGATALSKAFKALQVRSTRMGESAHKDGFLQANRWNHALIDAARRHKLI